MMASAQERIGSGTRCMALRLALVTAPLRFCWGVRCCCHEQWKSSETSILQLSVFPQLFCLGRNAHEVVRRDQC